MSRNSGNKQNITVTLPFKKNSNTTMKKLDITKYKLQLGFHDIIEVDNEMRHESYKHELENY